MTPAEFSELRYLAQRDMRSRQTRCTGKQRFENRSDALRAVSFHIKGLGARPYRCAHCAGWHVGTTIGHRRPSSRDEDRKGASHVAGGVRA